MMVPSVAKSEAVQAWLKEEGMVGSIKEKERERERRVLLFAAQQLHSQGDAFMPRPRQDADESCIEWGLEHVIFVHVVVTVARENLICFRLVVFENGPVLAVITVSHFKGGHKLHITKVFGPLCDDPCDALWSEQVHLQPLGAVINGCCPGVGLALLVQTSVMRVPGERLDPPGAERAGGCHLPVIN